MLHLSIGITGKRTVKCAWCVCVMVVHGGGWLGAFYIIMCGLAIHTKQNDIIYGIGIPVQKPTIEYALKNRAWLIIKFLRRQIM